MDYTKDAVDISRETAVKFLLANLGDHVAGPTGAYFTETHLVELMQDGNFYALADDCANRFLEDTIEPNAWEKKVKDCENRTNQALRDLNKKSAALKWKANALVVALAYDSKTLGDGKELWDGYHVALGVVKWNKEKKDLEAWIVEPKTLNEAEKWRTPAEEVRRWVLFTGR